MPLRSQALPPRSALPRDVEIPALPTLGDTWYDRGLRYWTRRVWMTVMLLVVVAFLLLVFPGFFILLLLTSLMPQTPNERHARLWMAERLRELGYLAPAT
jgi:hypothetical protein